jgi:hypothetical protein
VPVARRYEAAKAAAGVANYHQDVSRLPLNQTGVWLRCRRVEISTGSPAMGPRFIFAVLLLAFGLAIVFATLTTMRQVNVHTSSARTMQRS